MSYDYNLCIALESGNPQAAQQIRDHAPRHVVKHPGRSDWFILEPGVVAPRPSEIAKVQRLNNAERSRLILFGHGSRLNATVARRSADEVAQLLVVSCRLAHVSRISVVACWSGGNAYDLPDSVHRSFAQKLHWLLRTFYGIGTEVTARTEEIETVEDGSRWVRRVVPGGKPGTGPPVHKGFDLKWLFTWDGERQDIRRAYPPPPADGSDDEDDDSW